jgi:hypothetical protein
MHGLTAPQLLRLAWPVLVVLALQIFDAVASGRGWDRLLAARGSQEPTA